jgi:hypothetical protein
VHSGKGFGFACVNSFDTRMRVGTGKNLAAEHSGEVNVVSERRAARDELEPVHFAKILTDNGVLGAHHMYAPAGAVRYGARNKSKGKTQNSKGKSSDPIGAFTDPDLQGLLQSFLRL